MGIDINMTVGVGVHVPQKDVDAWVEGNEVEDPYEEFDAFVREYPGLTFDWVGNAWLGYEHGMVVWVDRTAQTWDMGREAEAGVYEPSANPITLTERQSLNRFAEDFGIAPVQIKPYVAVSVS